jgi:hypothetical protein
VCEAKSVGKQKRVAALRSAELRRLGLRFAMRSLWAMRVLLDVLRWQAGRRLTRCNSVQHAHLLTMHRKRSFFMLLFSAHRMQHTCIS